MKTSYDIIIVGAGPAGMAAAQTASKHGARVLVLDEQRTPGGQLYRAIESTKEADRPELGESYFEGASLARKFRESQVDYISSANVWQVSSEHEVGYSVNGRASVVTAPEIIVASGAQERPFPIPGWTLNGVMTVGAAQILLKESSIAIENAVFAGTGPLLYLVVHQYMEAGIPIRAVLDTTPRENYWKALPHMPGALRMVAKLFEGWRWKRQISASSVPLIENVTNLRIAGKTEVSGIEYYRQGRWETLDTEQVLLHQGVVPNVNLSLAAGCEKRWSPLQSCWHVWTDDWFQSSIEGISVPGDGAAIGGGIAAQHSGRIAALGALKRLDMIQEQQRDAEALPERKALAGELGIRPFLDTLFKPADQFRIPKQEETVVCRCEEITVRQVCEAFDVGCAGPNQLKSFSRCGMGPCQGRFCGLTVSEMIAHWSGMPVEKVGYYRLRPPVKPLLLQELANLKEPVKGK
ncbi:MAG: FAD-dependent oxidoreductase [Gammaproteobacteria bacterium]|nr:FAD-dependent oxidoreductase [Gammaproteobacteria bacterium]